MKDTIILQGNGILVVSVTNSRLPSFFSIHDRPAYVPATVVAIFPAHLVTISGHYHQCIVEYGDALDEMFSKIAKDFEREVEQEAHELSSAEKFAETGYAANMLSAHHEKNWERYER
jgi:hypothetical protein